MVTYDLEIKLKSGELLTFKGLEEDSWKHYSGAYWLYIYPSGLYNGSVLMDDLVHVNTSEIAWMRTTRNPKYDKELMQRAEQERYAKILAERRKEWDMKEAERAARRASGWRKLWMP